MKWHWESFFGRLTKKPEEKDDGSRKIRPEDPEDFSGIERAQNEKKPRPTNEWKSREDERPTP